MIGDDEVHAEAVGGFRFGESAHAGVDGDDETDAVRIGGFKNGGLKAIALEKTMRYMKRTMPPSISMVVLRRTTAVVPSTS